MHLIEELEREMGKPRLPSVHVGDTVDVQYLIAEGDKKRIQIFSGTVIAMQRRGIRRTIVVRRVVEREGVERIFPLHSPRVKDVIVTRRGRVRRAKLYYLRDRVGKATKVREKLGEKVRRDREREAADRTAFEAAGKSADTGEATADLPPETVEV